MRWKLKPQPSFFRKFCPFFENTRLSFRRNFLFHRRDEIEFCTFSDIVMSHQLWVINSDHRTGAAFSAADHPLNGVRGRVGGEGGKMFITITFFIISVLTFNANFRKNKPYLSNLDTLRGQLNLHSESSKVFIGKSDHLKYIFQSTLSSRMNINLSILTFWLK